MRITLNVVEGPHKGLQFTFEKHDTFLVGRSKHAHFQLPAKDKYFSRIHFMLEVNPPACRLIDMGSHNGTCVNGAKVLASDLVDGDQIRAGHTLLQVQVHLAPHSQETISFHADSGSVSIDEPAIPVVPGYALLRELGQGSMGRVFLAQHLVEEAAFVVKYIRPPRQGTPSQLDEFVRAARPLLKLDHTHLVTLRDVGATLRGLYFVADHVDGRNAEQVVERDGPLAIRRAVRWTSQILQALKVAHDLHLVHRDIKPSNLLVGTEAGKEEVKLSDFGLARVYQAAPFSGLSITGDLARGAGYMPPELLFNYQEANPLGDQYSVAATLYYLLTGMQPLDQPKEEQRKLSTLLRRAHVPIRERRADVPAALGEAIGQALSRAPAQRFKDVAAFRRALIEAVTE